MTLIHKSVALLGLLALAACANPGRFGGGGENTINLNAQPGIETGVLDASDPSSTAYFTSTVGDRVLFAVDESMLNTQARAILDGQANWLINNSVYTITVEGHADEQGTREYNLALGARRASAVQQYLIAQGVAPDRIRTITYGKERPIEICSEEACYSQNRRAVTVLNAGTTS